MPMGVKEKVGYAWPRTVNIYREKNMGRCLAVFSQILCLGVKDAL